MRNSVMRLLASILLAILAWPACADAPPKEVVVDTEANDAKFHCVEFITNSLDDPDKAKFDFFDYFPSQKFATGVYRVEATYKESDGSPKKKSECIVQLMPSGDWQLKSIKPLP